MNFGIFRDGHPRTELTLSGQTSLLTIEFIIDTGFEGDMVLPDRIARTLEAFHKGSTIRLLADGSPVRCPVLEITLDNDLFSRPVEVLVMPGNPLIGTALLTDFLLQIEMQEGGEVIIDLL